MNIEITEYSAYLTLPGLSLEKVQQIKQAAKELLGGLLVSVGSNHLDFDYSGRDADRKVLKFLCRAAPFIGSAKGEVECRLTTDNDETHFEFYAILHGRLYRQEAKLVKMPPVEVCLEPSETQLLSASVG
jgi:hypothetical protein